MPKLKLYPHQEDCLSVCREAFRQGHKKIVLRMPPGAGKTEIASQAMLTAAEQSRLRCWFVVHRRTLVSQTSKRLSKYNIDHGVMMAGEPPSIMQKIQVVSLDTVFHRYVKDEAKRDIGDLLGPELIFYDEAHTNADMFDSLSQKFPKAWVIGLTATPALAFGRPMRELGYTKMVNGPKTSWLIENGYLVGARYFAPEQYDYSKVKVSKTTGEYVESSADGVVDKPELIGNLVHHYEDLGSERPFVVFANSVAHSRHIAKRFTDSGYPCAHIDHKVDNDTRDMYFQQVRDGKLKGLSNYGVLDRGFDLDILGVCILARKFRNLSAYIQAGCRVTRFVEGKDLAIILDHAGNVVEHGFLDDDFEWTLDGDNNEKSREEKEKEPRPVKCWNCSTVYTGPTCPTCGSGNKPPVICPDCGTQIMGDFCHHCGYMFPLEEEEIVETNHDLVEIQKDGKKKKTDAATKREIYGQLLWICDQRGHKRGWADHKFKAMYSHFPARKNGIPMKEPSPEIVAFVDHGR